MKPDEKIVLFLTFITGLFAGAALYLMVFAPEYKADDLEEKSQFSIVGETYGGCALVADCVSFRLEADRSYHFLFDNEREEGELPKKIVDDVFSKLSTYRLQSLAAEVDKDNCESYVDGIDYKYEVVYEGVRYRLDTCRTTLSYDSELQQSLLRVWEYFEDPNSSEYPTIIEEGLSGWIINRMQGE